MVKWVDREMNIVSPNRMAWLLPAVLLVHQLEEYFTGFPAWYSELLNVQLSDREWIYINVVGLLFLSAFSLSYFVHKSFIPLVAVGTLVFINGVIHLTISIFTLSYSPGTVSGVVLMIPLGIVIFKRISPQLSARDRILAIVIGILVLVLASSTAMNI